jgi:hypothetical protein
MYGGANQRNMEDYHFVTEQKLEFMRQTAMRLSGWTFMEEERWQPIGEYLHALEDSYSHQSDPHRRDFSKTYGTQVGHARDLHEPDWTWKRSGLAHSMAIDTYQKLKALCTEFMGGCTQSKGFRTFAQIEASVDEFINLKPELITERQRPMNAATVWIEDVRDYTEKIRRLDSGFTPTPAESQNRFDKYLKHLEHVQSLREYRQDRGGWE